MPKPSRGFRIALLFEGHAAQFDGETPVVWLEMMPRKQHGARLLKPPKLRERHAIEVVNIGPASPERLRDLNNLFPLPVVEQSLDRFERINLR